MFLVNFFRKKQSPKKLPEKLNVTSVFNKSIQVEKSASNGNYKLNNSDKRLSLYKQILSKNSIDIDKLKQLTWDGIPSKQRSHCWRILMKYLPPNQENQLQTIARKRKEYLLMVKNYIDKPTLEQDTYQKQGQKQIKVDANRTLPDSQFFRHEKIQKMMKRLLYVWHMRHPASGYVQGMNDIITPFIISFLSDYIEIDLKQLGCPQNFDSLSEEQLNNVEADTYFCSSKMLDNILDNYTSSWPGIQKSFKTVYKVIKRVDSSLIYHFQEQEIDFYQIYFRMVTTLLLRQFNMQVCLRLFDTYLSTENKFFELCLYMIAAILLKYSKKMKQMGLQEVMIFTQNLPTKDWEEEDLATIIAEAYVYQSYFLQ